MTAYTVLKGCHSLTVFISITLFMLRFFWQWRKSAIMNWHWVQVAPHPNDTLLFASGIMLVVIFGFYPLLAMDSWLTEKLFGVIISILLGYATLDMNRAVNFISFVLTSPVFTSIR